MDCMICGERPANSQVCPGDHRLHHHGGIHLRHPVIVKAPGYAGDVGEPSSLVQCCAHCGREQAEIWNASRQP